MSTLIAQPSINTLLQIGDGNSPEAYTTIANVGDINGFALAATVVDVTSHSTGNPWREKLTTLLDSGKLTFKLFFIPSDTGHKNLLSLFTSRGIGGTPTVSGSPIPLRIVFPDPAATKYFFTAFISTFSIMATVAGVIEANVTFEGTGSPVFPA